MSKLKLWPLVDDKPVRLTVELPASTHRGRVAATLHVIRTFSPQRIAIDTTPA